MKYYQHATNESIVYSVSLIGRSKNRYWVTMYKNGVKVKTQRASEQELKDSGFFDLKEVDSVAKTIKKFEVESFVLAPVKKEEKEEEYVPFFERMQEFDFNGSQVRGMIFNGDPYFVGKDIAIALGYSNASKAVMNHVDEEDKRFEMLKISDSQNGNLVKTAIINESGLYSLIFGSKLEEAKRFKRWVTSEVLPSIRKYGFYSKMDSFMIEDGESRARRWLDEYKEKERALALAQKNQEKADFCDSVLRDESLFTTTLIAKTYGLTAKKLNDILVDGKIQYKKNEVGRPRYYLFDKYARQGFAKEVVGGSHDGSDRYYTSLKWTYRGRAFIDSFLKSNGIYPIENI